MKITKKKLSERFIRYAQINTQSKDGADDLPSTKSQFDLANLLVGELKELGCSDAHVDKHCYVMATLPTNTDDAVPVMGLIAHLDTSPESSGKDVKPRIIESYGGGDIILNKISGIRITSDECKDLEKCISHTLITSDGSTLLGADNKAGITAIIAAVEQLKENPDIPHGDIKIAFTPDEETGHGVDQFDIKKFGADYACTVDGGMPGELNMETFSADRADITVEGRNTHPGTAKGVMVNSIRIISEIISRLPEHMTPETTDGYDPFIHPMDLKGSVQKSTATLILRDFKTDGLKEQKKILEKIISEVQETYPKAVVVLKITESYRNMREELEKHPQVTERLQDAAKKAGVQPEWKPIRGGTDGSRLSAMGLPTPNLYTGGCNFHSTTEWLSIDFLMKTVETLLYLVRADKS
jgi:tripeptide aminopeptidase